MVLFIDGEIVHAWHICVFWGWLKTWKLECSNESSWQHTASEAASYSRRATGLADTAGAERWMWSESVPMENPTPFDYLEQGDLKEKFSSFNSMFYTEYYT